VTRIDALVPLLSRWADHLYPGRWLYWLGAAMIGTYVVTARPKHSFSPQAGALLLAAFCTSVALGQLCKQFHPTRGHLFDGKTSRTSLSGPHAPRRAAIFLLIFVLVGVVVIPAVLLCLPGRGP
jgi:hypothetical protein